MEDLQEICTNHRTLVVVAGGVLVATTGFVLYKWMRRSAANPENEYPSDTVILHQIGRGPFAPSLTPFAVKMETYLRMAKIPYQNVHDRKKSSKGKFPWISYNGYSVADSAFCIEFLNKKREVDLNSWMSAQQQAVALAFQRLAEDDIYWVSLCQRWFMRFDSNFWRMVTHSRAAVWFLKMVFSPKYRRLAVAQGMGRHSEDDVLHRLRLDLTALTDLMGTNRFLMGDQPCEQDCAIFGQLSQIYWQMPGPMNSIFTEEFPRLVAYCERMKDMYWPDWAECTTQGGTRDASK